METKYSNTIKGLWVAVAGIIGMFGFNLAGVMTQEEVVQFGDIVVQIVVLVGGLAGIVRAWYERYKRGDIKLSGRRNAA